MEGRGTGRRLNKSRCPVGVLGPGRVGVDGDTKLVERKWGDLDFKRVLF